MPVAFITTWEAEKIQPWKDSQTLKEAARSGKPKIASTVWERKTQDLVSAGKTQSRDRDSIVVWIERKVQKKKWSFEKIKWEVQEQ